VAYHHFLKLEDGASHVAWIFQGYTVDPGEAGLFPAFRVPLQGDSEKGRPLRPYRGGGDTPPI